MKKAKIYGVVGVAALAAVGGTFAFYTATDTFNNPFTTTRQSTSATEQFDPSEGREWLPNGEVEKKVTATNTGNGNVWVRVKFDEKWSGLNSNISEKEFNSADWTTFQPENSKKGIQNSIDDGWVKDDSGSVVYKKLADKVSFGVNGPEADATWYFKDGYFYYLTALEPNKSTSDLLESVILCGDTDMGKTQQTLGYFCISTILNDAEVKALTPFDEEGKLKVCWYPLNTDDEVPTIKVDGTDGSYYFVPAREENGQLVAIQDNKLADNETVYTYKKDFVKDGEYGYADAKYNLNITVEFVQADEESAKNVQGDRWAWNPETKAAISYTTESDTTE